MGRSAASAGGQGVSQCKDFVSVELAPGQVVESRDDGLVKLDQHSAPLTEFRN